MIATSKTLVLLTAIVVLPLSACSGTGTNLPPSPTTLQNVAQSNDVSPNGIIPNQEIGANWVPCPNAPTQPWTGAESMQWYSTGYLAEFYQLAWSGPPPDTNPWIWCGTTPIHWYANGNFKMLNVRRLQQSYDVTCYACTASANGLGGVAVVNFTKTGAKILRTLNETGQNAVDVAADAHNTLYVSSSAIDQSYDFSGIGVYARGKKTPQSFLYAQGTSSGPVTAGGVAVDAHGNVFGSFDEYGQGFVEEFPKGKNPGTPLGITTTGASSLLIDAQGNLVVCDPGIPVVEIFVPGSSSPKATIAVSGKPSSIALDPAGNNLYVTDPSSGNVEQYAYPAGTLVGASQVQVNGQTMVPFAGAFTTAKR